MNPVVAKAIRMEIDKDTDTIYLVFEVTDQAFKKEVRENWSKNFKLQLIEDNKE